jgi:hypothetical protein
MQVILDALNHSKAAPRLLASIMFLALGAVVSFWMMWAEVRHTEHSQQQIAAEILSIEKQLTQTLADMAIDLDRMKGIADQIQREEVTRLSGDSEYIRQWIQMRADQVARFEAAERRGTILDEKMSRILEALHTGYATPSPSPVSPMRHGVKDGKDARDGADGHP